MELDIKSLVVEEGRLKERLALVERAIRILQELCEHDFKSVGHDSHHDYYKCNKCGFEQSV